MKRNTGLFIGIAIILAVGVIAVAVINNSSKGNDKNKPAPTQKSTSTTNAGNPADTTAVSIKNYMFDPMVIKVKTGASVTWTNQDSVQHNVVADKVSSDAPNGPLIGKGQTYSFKFNKPGTYSFHCQPHSYMHGTVVVAN